MTQDDDTTALSEFQKDTALKAAENLARGNDSVDEWAVHRNEVGRVKGTFYIKQPSYEECRIRADIGETREDMKNILQIRRERGEGLILEFDRRGIDYEIYLKFEGDEK